MLDTQAIIFGGVGVALMLLMIFYLDRGDNE